MARRKAPPPPPTPENLAAATAVLNKARGSMSDFDATKAATEASREAANTRRLEETEALYTRLLTLLAEKRTLEGVAAAMGWTVAGLEVFLNDHRTFATTRWDQLRKRLADTTNIPAAAPVTGAEYVWTDENRRRLLEFYVDTADLLEAQKRVGCTPSQFNREVASNGAFAEAVKQAKKEAAATFELMATSEALRGNDKLMSQIMRDKGDSDTSRLTDQQLAARIIALLARVRARLAASGALGDDAGRASGVPGGVGGAGDPAPA
jgi:hypothetical protein